MSATKTSTNSVTSKPSDTEIPNDGTGVLRLDPWLEPFKDSLRSRYAHAQKWIKTLEEHEGGLDKFSKVSQPH
jgi:1,4-alpha-glucan branching enzyme